MLHTPCIQQRRSPGFPVDRAGGDSLYNRNCVDVFKVAGLGIVLIVALLIGAIVYAVWYTNKEPMSPSEREMESIDVEDHTEDFSDESGE